MANIRIDLDHELLHGEELVFKAPCDCTAVSGIKVYYPSTSGTISKTLIFKDAHGNVLTNINNLFSSGVLIKVLVDSTDGYAYILNADTNAYLEAKTTPVDNLESDRSDLSLSARMGSKLNKNIVKYNSETDKLDVYFNGVLVGSLPCCFQAFYLFNKTFLHTGITAFTQTVENGTVTQKSDHLELKCTFTRNVSFGRVTLVSNGIDMTKYSKLKVKGILSQTTITNVDLGEFRVSIGSNTYNKVFTDIDTIMGEIMLEIEVPIENLVGVQQITLFLNASNTNSGSNTATFKLQEIYLYN